MQSGTKGDCWQRGGSLRGGEAAHRLPNKCRTHPPTLQVQDMLPDYGDGYVAACLHQLGGSPERVLNALLEGSLPATLAGLYKGQSGVPHGVRQSVHSRLTASQQAIVPAQRAPEPFTPGHPRLATCRR